MWETARPMLIAFGLKVPGAIAVFIVGRMLIGFASRVVVGLLDVISSASPPSRTTSG